MSVDTALLEAQPPMMTMVLFVDWECLASSSIIKTSDLGALEGLDKYGRAFYKKFPVKSISSRARWTDRTGHGIELGSRARLGTRPSGTWVVHTHPVATAQPPGTAGGGLLREF